jgi:hypothetical protein
MIDHWRLRPEGIVPPPYCYQGEAVLFMVNYESQCEAALFGYRG